MITQIIMTLFTSSHVQLAKSVFSAPFQSQGVFIVENSDYKCEIDSLPRELIRNISIPFHMGFENSNQEVVFDGDITPGRFFYLKLEDRRKGETVFCLVEWKN